MGGRIDRVGQVFGRLTVVEYSHTGGKHAYWRCSCSCGGSAVVRAGDLQSQRTMSCGCLQREIASARSSTHGLSNSAEYKTWTNLLQRCTNTRLAEYPSYGGRGINVCDEWKNSFEQFFVDMGPRPTKLHTLDRRDNNGPYSKDNCRWATRKEQSNNRRSSKYLTYNGKTHTLIDWSIIVGISRKTIAARLSNGWSIEETLTTPVRVTNVKPAR